MTTLLAAFRGWQWLTVWTRAHSWLFYFADMLKLILRLVNLTPHSLSFFFVPQGENPIYKSAVTTVVNPKYEGKWWSPAFALTTLYGKESGRNGRGGGGGGFYNALTVCWCSHRMIAMHSATIWVVLTNLFLFPMHRLKRVQCVQMRAVVWSSSVELRECAELMCSFYVFRHRTDKVTRKKTKQKNSKVCLYFLLFFYSNRQSHLCIVDGWIGSW